MAIISGTVMLRPARVGLLTAQPSIADVNAAVCAATSSWGGLYFPIVDVSSHGDYVQRLETLSVDVLWALTNNAIAVELARQPGFRWAEVLGRSPFDPPQDLLSRRVLGSDWLIGRSRMKAVLPEWSNDDPMAALFGVWFDHFSSDGDGNSRRMRFAESAEIVSVCDSQSLISMVDALTSISLTTMEIDYFGDSPGVGIVVVNPSEPIDLLLFWNLRATGANVMPWPIGHENIVQPVIRRWIKFLLAQGRLPNVWYGDSTTERHYLRIWASEDRLMSNGECTTDLTWGEGS